MGDDTVIIYSISGHQGRGTDARGSRPGLEVAQDLADEWPDDKPFPLIVYVTAYDEFAIEAFGDKASASARNIHQFSNEIRINALYEIFNLKIDIFKTTTQFAGKIITQIFRI